MSSTSKNEIFLAWISQSSEFKCTVFVCLSLGFCVVNQEMVFISRIKTTLSVKIKKVSEMAKLCNKTPCVVKFRPQVGLM